MTNLLRNLIDIPERAGANDYVLKLADGVAPGTIEATIDQYVLTDDLVSAFDQALHQVSAALVDGKSRGAFLEGSFGSGKSHFMAVLYALLGHVPAARAKPELAEVIARYDDKISGKKILRLAYHFLGARTMEEVLLGGYVQQIRELHPDCVLPAVHRSDALFDDADRLRSTMGDEAFFARLNEGGARSSDVWAAVLGGSWDPASYDSARSATVAENSRTRLVSDLVRVYFSAFTRSEDYVSLEEGLAVVTAHARSLGYDAVVQFLDELVLWLAFAVRDNEFFARESQKLTKLVEFGGEARALPLVSFVARQMDLRRYFAEQGGAGAQLEAVDSALQHQNERFAHIVLGDDNLQFVAEKRLLKPRDASSKAVIDVAFEALDRRPAVWDVLLDGISVDGTHRGSDKEGFRRTYPFSPALVSTLRALASAMQRDRTALKVMQKLLVDGRESLTVDSVIPVGDVYAQVVDGQNAVTPEMGARISNAKKLYDTKLRPILLRQNNLHEDDVAGLPANHPFIADERLAKTLVLSAVATNVPALQDLTAGRLAALNHGSIVAPIPGQEVSAVLAKIRRWHVDVPEIHIGEGNDPVIRLQISEVAYETIIQRARIEDNVGRRRDTLKQLVYSAFGFEDVSPDAFGVQRQSRVWRGSRREIEVLFGNVRDPAWLTDQSFRAGPDTWRFVVDYPFDEDGRGPVDDLRRVEALRSSGFSSTTVAWLPHFLTPQLQNELGELVILDWVLASDQRYGQYADHLAEADRPQAKLLLTNRQSALHDRLTRAVQEAYGAAARTPGTIEVDPAHTDVIFSLDASFAPAPPVGTDLAAAFTNLLDQAFIALFPAHPDFQPSNEPVRPTEIATVLDALEQAHQDPSGRVPVEPGKRDVVRRVVDPLKIANMGQTHLSFDAARFWWAGRFSIAMGVAGLAADEPVTVDQLRGWITAEQPAWGLRPEIADLVIRAWAVLQDRAWYRHGTNLPAPVPGTPQFAGDIELRPEPLPATADWTAAVTRAGAVFGWTGNSNLTASAVGELFESVSKTASELAAAASDLETQLTSAAASLAVPPGSGARFATAAAAKRFVDTLRATRDKVAFIERIARTSFPSPDQAVARSLRSANEVAEALRGFTWNRLRPLLAAEHGVDPRSVQAKAILDRVRAAFGHDELTEALAPALTRAGNEAWDFVTAAAAPAPTPPGTSTPAPPTPAAPTTAAQGSRTIRSATELQAALDELTAFGAANSNRTITVEWRAE
ncbi:phage resistance protein [Jatrophihabitans sp.]|uniref:phage resistance protein n=1 Tax=Jatrophihabitans sp. TaxID=1932789 RepID=UPI002CF97FB1|nr:hypothetical protein [Jatrophihabitans sp.]